MIEARDWERAVELLNGDWLSIFFSTTDLSAVLKATRTMPEIELHRAPKIAYLAQYLGRSLQTQPTFDFPRTDQAIQECRNADRDREVIETAIIAISSLLAQKRAADAWHTVSASLPLVKASTANMYSASVSVAALWYAAAGHTALLVGEFNDAFRYLSIGWNFRSQSATPYAAVVLAAYLSLTNSLLGDSSEVDKWVRTVDDLLAQAPTLTERIYIERVSALAQLLDAADRLEIERSRPLYDLLSDNMAYDEFWSMTAVAIVRHLINIGDGDRAARILGVVGELYSTGLTPDTVHGSMFSLARAELALVQGRISEAEQALVGMTVMPMPIVATVCAARLALSTGDYARAARLVSVVESAGVWGRVQWEGRAIRAAAAIALGRPGEAARMLDTPNVFAPVQRRTLSLIPSGLQDRMRAELHLDDELLPSTNVLLSRHAAHVVVLTASERRVLSSLATPATMLEIAADLFITRNTLKSHVRTLYKKLGASSRQEALTYANALGLVPSSLNE